MPLVTRPQTPFMDAVDQIILKISETIDPSFKGDVRIILVGGVAVHVYTTSRVSNDLDAKFSHRIILPENLVVRFTDNGVDKAVSFDQNYTEAIALLHPDCWKDVWRGWTVGRISVDVISPVDLAVSKIGRWLGNDQDDVRALAEACLITAEDVEHRCHEALDYYIGNLEMVRYNLRDALETIREASQPCSQPQP